MTSTQLQTVGKNSITVTPRTSSAASLYVQLQSTTGDKLYPATKAAIVTNNSGVNLGTVEAGAQVNKIETIKVNGKTLQIVSKAVDITLPENPEYSISKQKTAETGFSATYYLTKDGEQTGAKINIPKDMVVQSGSVKTCETADKPVSGYKVGDKYIDLVLANSDNSHIYILVSDLIDVYTAGNGITINNNTVAINTSVVATKTDLAAKQNTLTTEQLAAANSGITAEKVATYDGHSAKIALKADKSTTLSGYGITDAYTKSEVDSKIAGGNYITYVALAQEG